MGNKKLIKLFGWITLIIGILILISILMLLRLSIITDHFYHALVKDPVRNAPVGNNLVSPADGRVVYAGPEPEDEVGSIRVSIFMSIFNVHINRSPLTAVIDNVRYTPGRFLPAYKREASVQNEQNEIELSDDSWTVTVRQIAGVVARRIVFYKETGDRLKRGERFGLIQFGSRVDVLLPPEARVRVAVGDRLKGGQSILAEKP